MIGCSNTDDRTGKPGTRCNDISTGPTTKLPQLPPGLLYLPLLKSDRSLTRNTIMTREPEKWWIKCPSRMLDVCCNAILTQEFFPNFSCSHVMSRSKVLEHWSVVVKQGERDRDSRLSFFRLHLQSVHLFLSLVSPSPSLYEYVCIYLTKDLQEVPSDIDLTRYWQVNTEGQSKRGQPLQFSIVQSQRKLIPIVGCSYAKGRMLWCVSSGISTGSLTWISDAQVINLSVTRRGSDGNSVVLFMTCVKKRPDAQNIPGTWNRSKQKFLHRIQKSFVPWVSAVEEQGYRSLWSGKSMCNVWQLANQNSPRPWLGLCQE